MKIAAILAACASAEKLLIADTERFTQNLEYYVENNTLYFEGTMFLKEPDMAERAFDYLFMQVYQILDYTHDLRSGKEPKWVEKITFYFVPTVPFDDLTWAG